MNKLIKTILYAFAAYGLLNFVAWFFKPSNSQSKEYKHLLEKYNQLENLVESKRNDKIDLCLKAEDKIDWHTNGVFMLKDYEIGEIGFHIFFNNSYFTKAKSNLIFINEGQGIYLPCSNAIEHDAEYVTFIYKGLKYFIYLSKDNIHWFNCQIFGMQVPTNVRTSEILYHRTASTVKFYFYDFNAHRYFIKKWLIDDNEYMTVYKTDFGKLAIEFHSSSKNGEAEKDQE